MPPPQQQFGGHWTETKLACLAKYLSAYRNVFKNQDWCTTLYIDAFAGTGYRQAPGEPAGAVGDLFEDEFGIEAEEEGAEWIAPYRDGSVSIALGLEPGFHEYHFIEKDEEKFKELQKLGLSHPKKMDRISCYRAEANAFLKEFCSRSDSFWKRRRAVLFLDPFGMSVDWDTLVAVAGTGTIDTWILVPLGIGINRLLERTGKHHRRSPSTANTYVRNG
jgi:three-Cys-motif partner protein